MASKTTKDRMWSVSNVSRFRSVILGAAALWIAWYHSYMHFGAVPGLGALSTGVAVLLNTLRGNGNAGVDVFLLMKEMSNYLDTKDRTNI